MPAVVTNTEQNKVDRTVQAFKGLNTVVDPLKLDLSWLTQADNINISRKGAIRRMRGWHPNISLTNCTGAYFTKDFQSLYVVDNGSLMIVNQDVATLTTLATGLSTTATCYFDEVNGVVFMSNGVDYWMIKGGVATPWGIPAPSSPTASSVPGGTLDVGTYLITCTYSDASGLESSNSDVVVVRVTASNSYIAITNIPQTSGYNTNVYVTDRDDAVLKLHTAAAGTNISYFDNSYLGIELPFWNTNQPRGTMPTYYGARMYTSEWYSNQDMSLLWRSLPFHFHHFDPGAEGIAIPGQVLQIRASRETHFTGSEKLTQKGVADTMIIGTDREIYSWDEDQLVLLASYGVIPGRNMIEHRGKIYFWTKRGLCRALPFENLHESTVSVPPGLSASATVVEEDGTRRYVVAVQRGGAAFNIYGS
jgi:hypothetical protein